MSEKLCPSCGQRRPASEVFCANDGWDLTSVPIEIAATIAAQPAPLTEAPPAEQKCVNGHAVRLGDFMCPECGADIAPPPANGFGESEQAPYDAGETVDENAAGPAPAHGVDGSDRWLKRKSC